MKSKAYALLKNSPRPSRLLNRIFQVILLFIVVLAFVPWQQFTIGEGRVIAYSPTERTFNVESPIFGRIKTWHVIEGAHVNAGDPIVTLNDNDSNLLTRLMLEKQAVLLKIEAAEAALRASEYHVKRQKKLYLSDINSRRQYELAQIEYARYQQALAVTRIENINLDVRIARQKRQQVVAKAPGFIFRRLTGQENVMVQAGQVLATIVPDTPSRSVALLVHGRDIPFVRLHQVARLQFDGWPAVQFRGWPMLAVGTFAGKVSFIDATDNGKGMFRVVIQPTEKWPNKAFLRQGVRVHGWVQLGVVPVWFEVWRQLNGFPPQSSPI